MPTNSSSWNLGSAGAGDYLQGAGVLGGAFGSLLTGLGQSEVTASSAGQARNLAQQALQLGAWRVGALRSKASQVIGEEKAGYAASGVNVNAGTASRTMLGTRFVSDLDVQTARNNAARQAYGYNQQALELQKQADAQGHSAIGGFIGSALGAIGGFVLGGPPGAMAGAALGGGVGGYVGGQF